MALSVLRPLRVAVLLAVCGLPAGATDDKSPRTAVNFDWFANAAKPLPRDQAAARTKAAIVKARALSKGATWVCTPAGSGQGSHCTRG